MATESELDLCVNLSKFTPNLQIPAGVLEVPFCAVNQIEKDFSLLQNTKWESFSTLEFLSRLDRVGIFWLILKLRVNPLPTNPLAVIPDAVARLDFDSCQ